MFDLAAVRIRGFKSYSGEHEFWFPEKAGLYYLTGRNEYNPRLGPNGTGKTSFVDAIFWCFYGKTSRGLRAGEVVAWDEENCYVEVDVVINDELHTILRTQSPNALILDGDSVDQDTIDKLLRMNLEAFQYAIILPQFGDSFFDLPPGPKLALFSSIMQLDFWLDRSKAAATRADVIQEKIDGFEKDHAHQTGRLESLKQQVDDLAVQRAKYLRDKKETRKVLKKSIGKGRVRIDELKEHVNELGATANKQIETVEALTVERKGIASDLSALNREIQELDGDASVAERHLQSLDRDSDHFEALKGEVCPTCLQPVDDKHLKKQAEVIRAAKNERLDELDAATNKAERARRRRKGVKTRLAEAEDLLSLAEEKLAGFSKARNQAERDYTEEQHTLANNEQALAHIESEVNTFDDLVDKAHDAVDRTKEAIDALDEDLTKARARFTATHYWIAGFKRIRLLVIEEALKQLEIEVNNNLTALGLVDWSITLDIERENKSGSITKGFTVLIRSPKHDEPVRYEAFSGGETQRIRLAGDLALSTLILQRVGLTAGIELYDEPSEHMSPEGLADLVEVLYDRAETLDRKVWLVDHQSFQDGNFAGILTAVMGPEGTSSLEYEAGLE